MLRTTRVHTPAEWERVYHVWNHVYHLRVSGAWLPYELDAYPRWIRPWVALWQQIPFIGLFATRTVLYWGLLWAFQAPARDAFGRWWATLLPTAGIGLIRLVRFPAQSVLIWLHGLGLGTAFPFGIGYLVLALAAIHAYLRVPTLLEGFYTPVHAWINAWGGWAGLPREGNSVAWAGDQSNWIHRQMVREAHILGTPPPPDPRTPMRKE
jgi:hypothetical protein